MFSDSLNVLNADGIFAQHSRKKHVSALSRPNRSPWIVVEQNHNGIGKPMVPAFSDSREHSMESMTYEMAEPLSAAKLESAMVDTGRTETA